MNVSFEGIGHMSVTFHTDIRQAGQVCKMGDQAKVTACADGDAFCGPTSGRQDRCAKWGIKLR